jgi:protein-S-isoprenylcysteine O-methyltransferase Ste14
LEARDIADLQQRGPRRDGPGALAENAYVRHPQYIAFIAVMVGFLVQWPTLVTLVMFPILVVTYVRLAHREEREVAQEFGDAWTAYARQTPRWFPRLTRPQPGADGFGASHP